MVAAPTALVAAIEPHLQFVADQVLATSLDFGQVNESATEAIIGDAAVQFTIAVNNK